MNHIAKRYISLNMTKIRKIWMLIIVLTIFILGLAGYFFYKNTSNTSASEQDEAKKLTEEISEFMILPEKDLPSVATVSDITKLKDQPFFKNAKNGNKLLIYVNSKQAILYDPEIHKIINVGPLDIATNQNTSSQAKIALRNGTTTAGLASREEIELKNAFPGINIVKTESSQITNYKTTLVIALNPEAKDAANSLAKFYNTSVVQLPSGEPKPEEIDILVILGNDQVASKGN